MPRTAEVVSQQECIDLRDRAVELARMPEAEIVTGIITHAAAYLTSTGRVGIEFIQDWDDDEFPNFSIEHTTPQPADEGSFIATNRRFTFWPNYGIFRRTTRYSVEFSEVTKTSLDHTREVDYSLYRTRAGRRLMRQRKEEVAELRGLFGYGELTRSKYDDLCRALGLCSASNLVAVGEEAAYRSEE